MDRFLVACIAVVAAMIGLCYLVEALQDRDYEAMALLDEGTAVTMVVTPIFSLQSDWERQLRITDGTATLTTDLGADTGWWRGSSLYRHDSGIYVLIEGEGGCTQFEASPPAIVWRNDISCVRRVIGHRKRAEGAPPRSAFYKGMTYLGMFEEAPTAEDGPIRFLGYARQTEPYLPSEL